MTQVLANFEELGQLKTEGVVPLVTPSDINMMLREDVATDENLVEKFMAIAPDKSGNLYKVPPVV
jgi:aspartyl/glutamyl-tRNA(Asn/Gln) amidotransferase C subunit